MSDASVVDAARLRITLLDIDPAPWREVEVPLSMTFKSLHNTIQAAFLWFNYHLWEFDYDGKIYGVPFDDGMDYRRIYNAETARLIRLRKDSVKSFRYVYDMGDDWQHRVDVVSLFEQPTGTRLPRFVAGEWSRPPEDVGGAPGYERFLSILGDTSHEEYQECINWVGGEFDTNDIQEGAIKAEMKRLSNLRQVKK